MSWSGNRGTLALILWALLLVSCFSLAAGIRMSQSASRMLPSYGVESGKPTMVPLAWKRQTVQTDENSSCFTRIIKQTSWTVSTLQWHSTASRWHTAPVSVYPPVCSPPALWGWCLRGSRCFRPILRLRRTSLQSGEGSACCEAPRYRSPAGRAEGALTQMSASLSEITQRSPE